MVLYRSWVYLLCMRPNQTAPNPSHIKHIPTIDEFGRSRVELIKNSSHWFMIYSSTNYAHFIASLSYYCVVEKKKNKKKKKPVKIVIRMNHNHICIHAHERYRLQSLSFLFHTNNWIFYANSAEFQFANQKETHHHLVGSFQSNPRFFFSVVLFNGNFDEIFDDLFQLEHYLHSLSRNAIQCWIFLQFVFVGVIFFLYI